MRVWVLYRVELELAGAGMEQHYPTGFYPLPSLGEARRLGALRVAPRAAEEARVPHLRPAPVGGLWTGGDISHRQLPPSAGHPLMERELRIFEMSDGANPVSLARSQLL
jgi:hypothetical protein